MQVRVDQYQTSKDQFNEIVAYLHCEVNEYSFTCFPPFVQKDFLFASLNKEALPNDSVNSGSQCIHFATYTGKGVKIYTTRQWTRITNSE